jgi:penicillin amidase
MVVIVVLVLLLLGAGGAVWYGVGVMRASLPTLDGQVRVPGLDGRVEVYRDQQGVPQIYASSAADLFRAQGYVQAQDRFWQMDVRRAMADGELAAMFGPNLVASDKLARTMGWATTASQELSRLAPTTRRYLNAYADGVNAYLRTHHGSKLGVEYGLLKLTGTDYEPRPWSAVDTLAWLKVYAWDLRGNLRDEIGRAVLGSKLTADQIDQLYPSYPYDTHDAIVTQGAIVAGDRFDQNAAPPAPAPRGAQQELAKIARLIDQVPSLLGPSGDGVGSNAFVVSGSLTTTGKPLLADDTHLAGQTPSVWYQVGLHCQQATATCPFNVTGFSFAGVPGVLVGHNASISWGVANLGADDVDLYLERVNGDSYLYQGRQTPLTARRETIKVAGAADVSLTVRATRDGPLLSDVDPNVAAVGQNVSGGGQQPAGYGVAVRWTGSSPGQTMDAVFALDLATNWTSFRTALRGWNGPAQSFVYADVTGSIGYQAAGAVPVRKAGYGTLPVAGWSGAFDWTGTVAFDALPHTENPPSGYIVAANNAVVGPGYPHLITEDWGYGYRSQRIIDLIKAGGKLNPAAVADIQNDDRSPIAEVLVPYLLSVKVDAFTAQAQDLLRGWDFSQPASGSPAAAYFNAVWARVLRNMFWDKLPEGLRPDGGDRWFAVVAKLLTDPQNPWWDNSKNPREIQTRDNVLTASLEQARLDLTRSLGKDPKKWAWSDVHELSLREQFIAKAAPAPLRWMVQGGTVGLGGGEQLVNETGWDAAKGFGVTWVPAMRMIVDLSDLDASRWVISTGESGHQASDNYTDQVPLWRDGRTLVWRFAPQPRATSGGHQLSLLPGG